MELTKFISKLNKVDGNIYVIEEAVELEDGFYVGMLEHDNINVTTFAIYTGPKLTGERIETYALSTPSLTPWKREIRVYASVPRVYISYECDGDTVEAEDINYVQEVINQTQRAVNTEETRAALAEQELAEAVREENKRAIEAEQHLDDRVRNEEQRAWQAEQVLEEKLTSEIDRAVDAEHVLTNQLAEEVSRAVSAEKVLTDSLAAEVVRAGEKESELQSAVQSEAARAEAAEKLLTDNLTAEVTRAKKEELKLQGDIQAEAARAQGAEKTLSDSLSTEAARATAAEKTLTDSLAAEVTRANGTEKTLTDNLATEVTRAKAAEKTNTDSITAEANRASEKELELQDSIQAETARAQTAEKTVTDNLSAEVTRAKAAEKANAEAVIKETARGQEAEGAIRDTVNAHTGNKNNPHGVTKAQTGLGNVPNVTTNDQTPTFTQAATLENISSGEKLTAMLGKISKALADLIEHFSDNVKHITAAERTNWNDTNAKKHTHSNKAIIDKLTQAMLDKLAGVAAGAEVNVQSDWSEADTESDTYIKNKPASMPASDVAAWAKAASKPAYGWNEITGKPSSFTPAAHNHTKSQITDMPTKVSQFTNDAGYITQADIDTTQNHTHGNKTVLDKITQVMLDKLAGIAEGANKYIHPTTAGNKHIPAGGASGQILRWSTDGTAVWGTDNNTTYTAFSGASSSAAGKSGLVPAPAAGAQAKYLRADGTWQTPPDTKYSHPASGVTAGTYQSVTVNAQGHVTGGTLQGPFTWEQLKGV